MRERILKSNVEHEVFTCFDLERAIGKALKKHTGLIFSPQVTINEEHKFIEIDYCDKTDYQRKLALAEFNKNKVSSRGLLERILLKSFEIVEGKSISVVILDKDSVMVVIERGYVV